jgi:hypothetical protein
MSESVGISYQDRWNPHLHPSGAGTMYRCPREDITRERVNSIIEMTKDLFT